MPRGIPKDKKSTQALHNPVSTGGAALLNSYDIPPPTPRKPVDLDVPRQDQPEIVTAKDDDDFAISDGGMSGDKKAYLAEVAFMEEPVQIILQKGAEKHAAPVVQCWVNGRGAEQFINGKWMITGWLPVGVPVITRRKYVAVLANAKADRIETETGKPGDEVDKNLAHRFTETKHPFSVLYDQSGHKGAAWLANLLSQQ